MHMKQTWRICVNASPQPTGTDYITTTMLQNHVHILWDMVKRPTLRQLMERPVQLEGYFVPQVQLMATPNRYGVLQGCVVIARLPDASTYLGPFQYRGFTGNSNSIN